MFDLCTGADTRSFNLAAQGLGSATVCFASHLTKEYGSVGPLGREEKDGKGQRRMRLMCQAFKQNMHKLHSLGCKRDLG